MRVSQQQVLKRSSGIQPQTLPSGSDMITKAIDVLNN